MLSEPRTSASPVTVQAGQGGDSLGASQGQGHLPSRHWQGSEEKARWQDIARSFVKKKKKKPWQCHCADQSLRLGGAAGDLAVSLSPSLLAALSSCAASSSRPLSMDVTSSAAVSCGSTRSSHTPIGAGGEAWQRRVRTRLIQLRSGGVLPAACACAGRRQRSRLWMWWRQDLPSTRPIERACDCRKPKGDCCNDIVLPRSPSISCSEMISRHFLHTRLWHHPDTHSHLVSQLRDQVLE